MDVGVVFFNWFGMSENGVPKGQYASVYPPSDGRETWDGGRDFYERHLRLVAGTGIDFEFVQIPRRFLQQVRTNLRMLKRLRREGLKLRAAPYLALESFRVEAYDFARAEDRDDFVKMFVRRLKPFAEILPEEALQRYDDRVLLGLWHIESGQIPMNFLDDVREAVRHAYGWELYISGHADWRHAGVDQVDWLFNGMEGFRRCERPDTSPVRAADIIPGFYHALKALPYWAPRDAGRSYREAWSRVLAEQETLDLLFIESWNEEHESSGIRPGQPIRHRLGPDHPVKNRKLRRRLAMSVPMAGVERADEWGADPELYLDITREHIQQLQ